MKAIITIEDKKDGGIKVTRDFFPAPPQDFKPTNATMASEFLLKALDEKMKSKDVKTEEPIKESNN